MKENPIPVFAFSKGSARHEHNPSINTIRRPRTPVLPPRKRSTLCTSRDPPRQDCTHLCSPRGSTNVWQQKYRLQHEHSPWPRYMCERNVEVGARVSLRVCALLRRAVLLCRGISTLTIRCGVLPEPANVVERWLTTPSALAPVSPILVATPSSHTPQHRLSTQPFTSKTSRLPGARSQTRKGGTDSPSTSPSAVEVKRILTL